MLYNASNYLVSSDIFTACECHTNFVCYELIHNYLENVMFKFISAHRIYTVVHLNSVLSMVWLVL